MDYWLDLGNNSDSGQFVLGEPLNRRNRRHRLRLRTVAELFPEVVQVGSDDDGLPSCSAAEALDRQEPFVNLRLGEARLGPARHGYFATGRCLITGRSWILGCGANPLRMGSEVLGPPPKETRVTFSIGDENRALQPDILIMLRADSKRGNEYSSEFSVENATSGARVPGPFVRHRVLAGAGR